MTVSQEHFKKELMAVCLADPILFLRTFLPHWFTKPVPWAHRGVLAILLRQTDFLLHFGTEEWPEGSFEWTREDLDLIIKYFVWRGDQAKEDDPGHPLFILEEEDGKLHLQLAQFTQVVWPRGFGKTTLVNAANIFKIVYRLRKYLVYLSETATHAEMQLANVQRELETNSKLIEVFGVQKPERADVEKWTASFFETLGGVAVSAKGRGGQVRGLLHNNERPDDITIDDVEDTESVQTSDQRRKTLQWFKADVEPALNQLKGNGSINMIGTLLHREALIPTIMGDPDWVTVVFGALMPDGTPLWQEYMSREELERKRRAYARAGMLEDFYREFLSKLFNSATAKFPGPFIIVPRTRADFTAVALVVDPAISDKENADFCAFGVTGITDKGLHHVLDTYGRKGMTPREQVDKYFELKFLWDPTHCGVEAIAYQAALVHLIQEEMFRKASQGWGNRAYFEVTPIKHPPNKAKLSRVEGVLAPRYSSGYVTHQRKFPELETQLLEWPANKKDFPDVVAMCITLLDPYAAMAFQPADNDNPNLMGDPMSRDVYEELDDRESAI